METVLDSPVAGNSAKIPTNLSQGLAMADMKNVMSPSAFRARISYIGAAFVISAMLVTWGMSLVALGSNATEQARVFAASLVLFGVISSLFCTLVLFRTLGVFTAVSLPRGRWRKKSADRQRSRRIGLLKL